MTQAVFAAGLPAPEVFGEVTLDGRFGIVLGRLDGPTLLQVTRSGAVTFAQAGAIIASDNYLEGSQGVPAMRLQLLPENGPFTVLGNITSGEIFINSGALPPPWASLNVVAS